MDITINSIFFIFFSTILLLSAILSVVSKKIIYSLLWAMLTFCMVGMLFLLLGAVYNAMVQFLIYFVAIPILIAVSIMLVNSQYNSSILLNKRSVFVSILPIGLITFFTGKYVIFNNDFFEVIQTCNLYVNQFSDLITISQNILGAYPVLILEFSLGILITVIGLVYYEK